MDQIYYQVNLLVYLNKRVIACLVRPNFKFSFILNKLYLIF